MGVFRVDVTAVSAVDDELETTDEVVFGQPNVAVLLGARAAKEFGVMVGNINKRFAAAMRLIA